MIDNLSTMEHRMSRISKKKRSTQPSDGEEQTIDGDEELCSCCAPGAAPNEGVAGTAEGESVLKEAMSLPKVSGNMMEYKRIYPSPKKATKDGSSQGVDHTLSQHDLWTGSYDVGDASKGKVASRQAPSVNELCGSYFDDVAETLFTANEITCCVAEHPDRALRHSGLIKQEGMLSRVGINGVSKVPVVFDERTLCWVDKSTRQIVPEQTKDVKERRDIVPLGVIHVVGTLELPKKASDGGGGKEQASQSMHSSQTQTNKTEQSPLMPLNIPDWPLNKPMNESKMAGKFAGSVNNTKYPNFEEAPPSEQKGLLVKANPFDMVPKGFDIQVDKDIDDKDEKMIMVIGDPDSNFLSDAEVKKYIKHYLTRAIIKSARSSGASIIVGGCDDIARQLAIGYDAFIDPLSIKTDKGAVPTQLIGVNALSKCDEVQLGFSDNILLHADGGHAVVFGPNNTIRCKVCDKPLIELGEGTAINSFCTRHPDYLAVYKEREANKERIDQPTRAEIKMFKHRMLEALNHGFLSKKIDDVEGPPNRSTVPVVLVVFGGDETTREECHLAVARGWPIIVFEGSGGYADVICKVMNHVQALNPDASSEDLRTLLGGIDPVTSEIIINGKVDRIKPGQPVDVVERRIASALKGDEILYQAWKLYSIWRHNQREWQYYHQINQLALLLLGLLATLASVLQTFLVLLYRNLGANSDFHERWAAGEVRSQEVMWFMGYRTLQWLVIGLPITFTLIHAIFQRMNPWAKLVALRIASSSLLKEIYVYRTRTLGYSSDAIKKSQRSQGIALPLGNSTEASQEGQRKAMSLVGDITSAGSNRAQAKGGNSGGSGDSAPSDAAAAAPATELLGFSDTVSYSSREELLGLMIDRIQRQLGQSEAGSVVLVDPYETIPPPNIAQTGDTGLGDLTPDDYVKFRVLTSRSKFSVLSTNYERQQMLLSYSVLTFGALGTALAALSAYGLGYLQAWVAFTTVLVNSLSRFLDFTRIAAMSELCNTANHRLSDIERWWSSLGTEADSEANRSKLVTDTERILQDELDGWSKQMQALIDDTRRSDTEKEDQQSNEQRSKQQAEERKAIGVDLLQSDSITLSLADPNSATAGRVRRQILDLNDKLGTVIKAAEDVGSVEAIARAKLIEQQDLINGRPKLEDGMTTATLPLTSHFDDDKGRRQFLFLFNDCEQSVATESHGARWGDNSGSETSRVDVERRRVPPYLNVKALAPLSLRLGLSLAFPTYKDNILYHRTPMEVLLIAKRIVLDEIRTRFIPKSRARSELTAADTRSMDYFTLYLTEKLKPTSSSNRLSATSTSVSSSVHSFVEDFCAEMFRVHHIFDGQLEFVSKAALAQIVENGNVKDFLLHSKKEELDDIVSCVCKDLFDEKTLPNLLRAICHRIAVLHISHLLEFASGQHRELYGIVLAAMSIASLLQIPIETSSSSELLACLPERLRHRWSDASTIQLVENFRVLAAGTSSSRCFSASRRLLNDLIGVGDPMLEWMEVPENREVFVSANDLLSQDLINRCHKRDLVRTIQSAPSVTKEHADAIAANSSEEKLKAILSTLQATQSNSFACHVIQRLTDAFSLIDYKDLLSGDEMEALVTSVATLPNIFSLSQLSKSQMLEVVAVPSVQRHLGALDEDQLRLLLLEEKHLLDRSYYDALWDDLRCATRGTGTPHRQRIIEALDGYAVQRLIFRVAFMDIESLDDLEECTTVSQVLFAIGDAEVWRALYGICISPQEEVMYVIQLAQLLQDIYYMTNEPTQGPAHAVMAEEDNSANEEEEWIRALSMATSCQFVLVRTVYRMLSFLPPKTQTLAKAFFGLQGSKVDVAPLLTLVRLRSEDITIWQGSNKEAVLAGMDILSASRLRPILDYENPEVVKSLFLQLDTVFDLELSYAVFEEIAHRCEEFDLRDLVVDVTDRFNFAIAWHEFIVHGEGALQIVNSTRKGSKRHRNVVERRPAGSKGVDIKEQLLQALMEFKKKDSDHFCDSSLLLRTVRGLDSSQLQQLLSVIKTFLKRTHGGIVFDEYCQFRRKRLSKAKAELELSHTIETKGLTWNLLAIEPVANYILSVSRGNRSGVEDALCGLKYDEYITQRESLRPLLCRLIPNDDIVYALTVMDKTQVMLLFNMIGVTRNAQADVIDGERSRAKRLLDSYNENVRHFVFRRLDDSESKDTYPSDNNVDDDDDAIVQSFLDAYAPDLST